jgi:predicted RNA methylase
MRLDNDVISVLDRSTCEGVKLFLPPQQLERAMYLKVNKAIDALGGKWSKKEKAHVFEENIGDAIEDAIASGSVENRKQAFGFFETPAALAKWLVATANIGSARNVLEPSAGRGAIVRAIIPELKSLARIDCWEIDPRHHAKIEDSGRATVVGHDFLQARINLSYGGKGWDRIIANPPFARQQDIDHVLHMHRMLAPGGFLVSVMCGNVMFRDNKKTVEFREFVGSNKGEIEALPDRSFHESGTDVSTCVATVPKA